MAGQRELVEQMFEAALALKPGERDAFLVEACGSDRALRRMVDDLLEADARAGSFLQYPPFDFLEKARMGTLLSAESANSTEGNGISLAPRSAGRLEPGEVLIDRFVIVRFIAKGGMGEVYEVEDTFLQGVHVALKTILPHIANEPELRKRFEREVLLAREVTHPNLCPIYDIFHCKQPPRDFLFLTMKLLPGKTLAARLKGPAAISTEEGLAILKQMALGLAAIHAAGITHRDIKPTNVMLDGVGPDVRLYITDFGLARAYESETTLSGRGMVAGTPDYIAPELFLGHPPSQASDLFAFGVVLHEIFTGQKPVVTPDSSSVVVSPRLSASGVPPFCIQLVKDCLDANPKRRCRAFEHALDILDPRATVDHSTYSKGGLWTRRRFVGAAVTATCAAAGGVWWERDAFYNLLHPLPKRRFVALLSWPKSPDSRLTPMLTGVLMAIKNELSRVEAFDRDLFVISPEDVNKDLSGINHLSDVCDPLGANLVLAASCLTGSKHFQLFLRLLDPFSSRPLREKKLTATLADVTSVPGKAVVAASSLLNLDRYVQASRRTEQGTQSPAAFMAFQSAEGLMKEPNDAGLDPAIEKYKEAVTEDAGFAIAYAKLAQAYVHSYGIRREPGALELARGNSERSLALDPNLVDGYLARAVLLQKVGDEQGALAAFDKALALDRSNPDTLVAQAQVYVRLNRWAHAEQIYHRVLMERPNSWVTYNDLGFAFDRQGKYQEAIRSFHAASVAAPRNAMPFANLGGEFLQIGDFAEAIENSKKSLALQPSDLAALNISLALRYQGKYDEALPFALKAVELNPADDRNWLELGDCYSSLRNRSSDAKGAYLRAAKETERHLRTDKTNGPDWVMLALYRVKSGAPETAPALLEKAELLGIDDMDSQLYKARVLELLGRRNEALATLAVCFQKGATALQIAPFPDLQPLRKDPRYRKMVQSKSGAIPETN
jgi:serine/threonine protein kinase/Tfp pilus assembly protein PilF